MNRLILLGRMTRDAEMRHSQSGTAIAKGGIAVNSGKKDAPAMFIDFVAFGKTAEMLAQWAKKGKPLLMEGRVQLEQWTSQDGTKRSRHTMIVDRWEFLPSDGGARDEQQQQQSEGDADYGDVPF